MPLSIRNLSFSYSPGRDVLTDITADLASEALTVVIGPNGAGKSTLLRLLLGVLAPGSGSVTVDDAPVCTLPPARRAARIAYVPQSTTLAAPLSVIQYVRLGRFARPSDERAVAHAISTMDLTQRSHEPFAHLSAGQQQRATLARVLAQLAPHPATTGPAAGSQVILADEPCAAMDPAHALHAMALLRDQAATLGRTVVVVLHDFTAALRFAQHALILDAAGRLAARGTAISTLTPGTLAGVFGVPFDLLTPVSANGPVLLPPVALAPRLP